MRDMEVLVASSATTRARLFDLSHDMLSVIDQAGSFTEINESWTRVLGWSEADLVGRPFLNFVHAADCDRTRVETALLFRGHLTLDFRNRYVTSRGEYRWFDWRATYDGTSGVILAAARDVTATTREGAERTQRRELGQGESVSLSPRERQILCMIADGGQNPTIAHALSISVETVKAHVSNLLVKFDAGSRTQAVASALRAGLID
ncbi:MAG: sensor hybrid histidine kinase [Thermoleophilia bacterium]|nr:sensor hybrid histidine kinase [Thermoleophilia bacterium]